MGYGYPASWIEIHSVNKRYQAQELFFDFPQATLYPSPQSPKKIPYPPPLHWFDQSGVFHLHFPNACVTGEASTPPPNSTWEEKDCVSAFIHCRDQSHFPRSALDARWKSQDAEGKKVLAYYKSSPPFPISFLTGDSVLVLHPLGAVSGCNLLSPALSAWVTKHFC